VTLFLEVGPIFAKRWNFNPVSFDPRGVGLSGPKVACTTTNSTSLRRRELNALGDLTEVWNETLELSIACAAAMKRTNARYIGTSAVVQDMMHFTGLQATARNKNAKTALINYYGVSYGTVITQTLVTMYPGRVNRILLDANVYSVAHYQGWEPNRIDDFVHAVFTFSKLCFQAGPRWCVLATGANSPQQVQARFDAALEQLRLHPEKAPDGSTFSDSTFLAVVSKSMYSPRRDYAGWANATARILATSPSTLSKRDTPEAAQGDDGLYVITAVDIAGRYPFKTYEQWKTAAEKLAQTAPYFAYNYATTNG
jgi:pimeloyl-ACP methyl ester carboxylesterase